ncbi:P-type conjugative transfer protein VirB9 [Neorhizobium sp. T786]|uniref:P-type conjugative transfer protein VirB9 n=1 Tax=Pseudorhizobium xiangyangii TaxID=2883104 RepID=UPI001CFF9CE0|nr:P-type conjugative transfer protein VirB9 [Neorhizobium xiangyangii]MCB5205169.1 P-type conjugative transfer protein VirB9 [Neorhizobium xiangyangii]
MTSSYKSRSLRLIPSVITASLLAFAGSAMALETPMSGQKDERMRLVSYSSDQVVKVVGRERASTQIIFAETEQIVHVAVGDAIAWEAAPAQNILFLKPREFHPVTNLQVVTMRANGQRRVYQFELTATQGKVDARDAYFAIQFRYPTDEAELARLKQQASSTNAENKRIDEALSLSQSHSARNFAFSAQGSRSLEPDAIYDDGKVTVFRFNGNRPVPAIYIIRDDGTESLVPNTVRDQGRAVVVHATAGGFRLRDGQNVLCITNEGHDRVGVNTGTGTTSSSVERAVVPNVTGAPK